MSHQDSCIPSDRKVLLVGWDAADWRVARPLLENGEMPNLAALMKRGVHGNIATLHPPFSPTLWTSIATGKRPPKHGVLGFTEPLPDGSGVRPVSLHSRKTKALWNILAQNGKRSIVVGWWPSYPAESFPGAMVSNFFQHVPTDPDSKLPPLADGVVSPPRIAADIADLRVRPWEIPMEALKLFVPQAERIDQTSDKSLHDLAKILAETMSIHAAATDLIEREPWDFAAVYFDAIDHFCHRFMRFHPPRQEGVSAEDFELYQDIVTNAYRYHDAMLGRYLELAGPEAHVIVLSDHGFRSGEDRLSWVPAEPAGPAAEHRDFGIFVMAGPGIRENETIHGTSILDITPTILTLFGLPVGLDMDGSPQVQAWEALPEVTPVPSWDDIAGEDGQPGARLSYDARAVAAQMDQLVALGYIEPPPDNVGEMVRETKRELDYNLACALADGGEVAKAIPILEKLWETWPEEHRFGRFLLDLYEAAGKAHERRSVLDRLHERASRLAGSARKKLAELEAEEPETTVDAVEARSPKHKRKAHERRRLIQLAAGLDLRSAEIMQVILEGDREKAAELMNPLLEAEKQHGLHPSMAAFLAFALLKINRHRDALGITERLIRLDPDQARPHMLRAEALYREGDWESVVTSATESLALVYFNPPVHAILGFALDKLGRRDEALAELQVALRQNPRHMPALKALEVILADHPELADQARMWRVVTTDQRRAKRTMPAGPASIPDDSAAAVFTGDPPQVLGRLAPEETVIVSGLPRSGTSMLMGVLKAGGLALLEDDLRVADENNQRGYHEYQPVKSIARDSSWAPMAAGKAIKIITPLLPHFPGRLPVRLIIMHRSMPALIASQEAMRGRLGHAGAEDAALLASHYAKQLETLQPWLARHRATWPVLHVSYEKVLSNPAVEVDRIAKFLGPTFDSAAAVTAIDPLLKRY